MLSVNKNDYKGGTKKLILIMFVIVVFCIFMAVWLTIRQKPSSNGGSAFDYYSYYYKINSSETKESHFQKIYDTLIETQAPVLTSESVKKNAIKNIPEIKFTNITKKTIADRISDYIVIDIETTGLQVGSCEIIEVAAIKFNDFIPTECFTTLLKPKKPIPDEATTVNGITNEMVSNKPFFNEIVDSLSNFIGDYNLVGHNLYFDLKFLYKNGYDFTVAKRKYFDTLELSKKVFKKIDDSHYSNLNSNNINKYLAELKKVDNYKLGTLCKHVGIPDLKLHRALNDSLETGILFKILVNEISE